MLKGEVDVSGPTEYVIVGGAFRDEKIQIVSTIVKADFISIIGRKDHGIEKVSDLAGKGSASRETPYRNSSWAGSWTCMA